jgi:hypothetical protein
VYNSCIWQKLDLCFVLITVITTLQVGDYELFEVFTGVICIILWFVCGNKTLLCIYGVIT